jgi:hypothetical protein
MLPPVSFLHAAEPDTLEVEFLARSGDTKAIVALTADRIRPTYVPLVDLLVEQLKLERRPNDVWESGTALLACAPWEIYEVEEAFIELAARHRRDEAMSDVCGEALGDLWVRHDRCDSNLVSRLQGRALRVAVGQMAGNKPEWWRTLAESGLLEPGTAGDLLEAFAEGLLYAHGWLIRERTDRRQAVADCVESIAQTIRSWMDVVRTGKALRDGARALAQYVSEFVSVAAPIVGETRARDLSWLLEAASVDQGFPSRSLTSGDSESEISDLEEVSVSLSETARSLRGEAVVTYRTLSNLLHGKQHFFSKRLGYGTRPEGHEQLSRDLRDLAPGVDTRPVCESQSGRKYLVRGSLQGPKATADVGVLWLVPHDGDLAILITAYQLNQPSRWGFRRRDPIVT